MNVSVVGTGYVGLVTGTCFAETGMDVTCVDVDETKMSRIVEHYFKALKVLSPATEPFMVREMGQRLV